MAEKTKEAGGATAPLSGVSFGEKNEVIQGNCT
jgi:hypothetical protein